MLFTKASEYALLAAVVIAKSKDEPQDVEKLSSMLGISKSFLAKILQTMAKAGILTSYKGSGGGFLLTKKPSETTILEVVKIVDQKSSMVFSCSISMCDCPKGQQQASLCSIWPLLNKVQDKVDLVLQETTLADLINP